MEFDDIVVKENPGLCRCCLSEGCYKDLGSEYAWMNDTEVYADMLLECFDISISQINEGPNGPNRLICEVCITRLRDACNFKKQVLECEKKFIDMVARGEFRKVIIYQEQMKAEEQDDDLPVDDYLEDPDFEDDEPLKREPQPTVSAEPLKVKSKRGRPKKYIEIKTDKKKTKTDEKKTKTVAKGELLCNRQIKNVEDLPQPRRPGTSKRDERQKLRHNVIQVLINSMVMPFRWLKSSYRCFYCYDIFDQSSDLKAHQISHLDNETKHRTMNNYWEPVVYVDVSDLSCRLCPEILNDLYELIDHLVSKHDVEYNNDVGSCMVPFKLDNLTLSCLVCGANFFTFGPLLQHTNKDHKGTSRILCEICGQNFKDNVMLRTHVKIVHENAGLLCTECGEKFDSKCKLKTHQKHQHDIEKKYVCLVCPLIFQSHYKRSRHMAMEHENREVIRCPHCPKTFVFRSMMMTHVRDGHLKVKNHICSICGWKAVNSNRLKNHMYKHSGEKNFKCESCDKAFTTRKIMRAHFARIHKQVQIQQPLLHYDNQVDHYNGQ